MIMHEKKQRDYKHLPQNEQPPLSYIIEKAGLDWLSSRAESAGFSVDNSIIKVDGTNNRSHEKRSKAVDTL
jgi:hypothetical protein